VNNSIILTESPGNHLTSVEMLSFTMFRDELRHVARFIAAAVPSTPAVTPLDAVVNAIRRNPALSQARLLTRVLAAYIGRQVSFRSAEVAAFDREHLALMVALMNAHDAGNLNEKEWVRAAEEAEAAQRDIDG
jgi:hypothetical protein